MISLCAWCLKEGKDDKAALIGEREPLADKRVTHGICHEHRAAIEKRVAQLKEDAERMRKEVERHRDAAEHLEGQVDP